MGLQGSFVTHKGFIGGAAVHADHPIVAIVGFDRELYLLNRVSGDILWQKSLQAAGVGEPKFIGDLLLIPTGDGLLTAYDIKTRKEVWRRQFSGLIRTPISMNDEMIFVCDGTNSIYALKRTDGELVWQHRLTQPKKFSLQGESKPLVSGDHLIMGYSDGRVIAFNAKRGDQLWTRDLAPQVNMFEDIDADLAVVGGTLYAASAASGLYALSLKEGKIQWFYPIAGIVTMSDFEGDLIVGLQHGELGRFSVLDRSFTWRVRFGTDGAPQRLIRFPYGIALTVSRGGLYVLDAHSGQLRDQFSAGSGLQGPLAFSKDGWLYTSSLNGYLYAFSPR
jgi:outer membrane protein assembly factor BamB